MKTPTDLILYHSLHKAGLHVKDKGIPGSSAPMYLSTEEPAFTVATLSRFVEETHDQANLVSHILFLHSLEDCGHLIALWCFPLLL